MAASFQAPHHINTVRPLLNSRHKVHQIHFSGTGNPDNLDVRRIVESHRTCQVRSRISSIITAKSDNGWLKFGHYIPPASKASILHKI